VVTLEGRDPPGGSQPQVGNNKGGYGLIGELSGEDAATVKKKNVVFRGEKVSKLGEDMDRRVSEKLGESSSYKKVHQAGPLKA